jgi:site-specific DNA-methyltransferase (adenine-specific)
MYDAADNVSKSYSVAVDALRERLEKSKVVIGDCTLYCEDAEFTIPTLVKVDHVITDAPYSDLVHDTRGKRQDLRKDRGPELSRLDFDSITSFQDKFSNLICKVCNGWFLTFSDIFGIPAWREAIIAAGGKSKSVALWIKPDCAPQFNGQKPATAFECIGIFWTGTGYSQWNGGGSRGLYTHNTNSPDRHGIHPTEKPVGLMRELVTLFTQYGQTILDPFMGSGTTGVACVKLGRKFIGIERERKYFDIACKRIEEAYAQGDLFVAPPSAKPKQLDLEELAKTGEAT